MEYSCYKDAFDAVVDDNDGVLPDLYEVFDYIIYCRPAYLTGPLTVAEIVAHALIEASETTVVSPLAVPSMVHLPSMSVAAGELLYLDKLLDQAITCLN
jgi:hypothetical protein